MNITPDHTSKPPPESDSESTDSGSASPKNTIKQHENVVNEAVEAVEAVEAIKKDIRVLGDKVVEMNIKHKLMSRLIEEVIANQGELKSFAKEMNRLVKGVVATMTEMQEERKQLVDLVKMLQKENVELKWTGPIPR